MLGQIKLERGDGDEIVAQGGDVGVAFVGGEGEDRGVPEIVAAARIFAALVGVVPGARALADDFDAGGVFIGAKGGDVDADDLAAAQADAEDLVDAAAGQCCGSRVIRRHVALEIEREGDGGQAEESGFDCGGHRAGIDDVDANVGAGVDAADDQVGPAGRELADGEFHAIGRASGDGGAAEGVFHIDFAGEKRLAEGDAVAGGALDGFGGDDLHIAHIGQMAIHGDQSGSGDAIVVGQKDELLICRHLLLRVDCWQTVRE